MLSTVLPPSLAVCDGVGDGAGDGSAAGNDGAGVGVGGVVGGGDSVDARAVDAEAVDDGSGGDERVDGVVVGGAGGGGGGEEIDSWCSAGVASCLLAGSRGSRSVSVTDMSGPTVDCKPNLGFKFGDLELWW